ncbi:FERM conserved site,Vinculin/alpha-catenin,PH domain-like,IRS-type PTB domain,Talin, central,Ubiquitin- [Cinara cedri]|uniref:FERM conserved site,Vinculin/alpha-catenin,PH domain-like,IRS-type PTB domain,Talin, central,Ubiquitin n=1 Tax=Cinara cedri TaxID=506608 RepID=A0A5E4NAR7_9HEMI|nr:FERM conserved site,Vinculin/alpha-catenin,PH domain-like,IRS-type PTB domain,Talin, central,Ubiquitin- [Cinara cedri]
MATLSLRILIVEQDVTKTMQFDPTISVYNACQLIREKISDTNLDQPKNYGLFLVDEDIKKGVWLEPGRNLEYYILRNGDLLEYRKKLRTLKVHMLDGTLKTLLVDDSQPVANLMVVICTKIGITNHDEYSLVRENLEEEVENKANFGTLTLKRKKEDREREKDAKMEQLRKKLKTDDEVNWVDPSKTLREQGIDEGEPVLLRRKFFFSDGNIDSHDPVQLNLLYVQARDAILDGTHPVTEKLALQLAGIQTHIQFGNYCETKHRPPFLDLKEFLPQSYIKIKGIEKKIFSEHKKHFGLSELDAKVLYTKTARSLPTYGVTFFLVKEKMKGKNKLVPRLLGVTKESVLRLDERTKEILQTWPLTTVRRWGASPNTFTLDFGDYSDQYYSVQTTEAEQILQLISGYIDIILKKKKSKDHFGIEGDEGSTMIEDSVSPLKATILQHESSQFGKVNTESVAKPAVMRAGADGARPYGLGHVGNAQYTTLSGQINIAHTPTLTPQNKQIKILSAPQKALCMTISNSQEIITTIEKELITKAVVPEFGTGPASIKLKETTIDSNKQNVSDQIAAMNAATAQVVTLTSGDIDYSSVEQAITSITTNLPEMSQGVRVLAALTPSGDHLLDAARKLCFAFTDLLKAVQPDSNTGRQNLLNAASKVGEASQQVLTQIGDDSADESREILLNLAKAVTNTTAALVVKAENVAATVELQHQSNVRSAATTCALTTSQLVACTKVVAGTVENPSCKEQLMVAAREVVNAVEDLVSICNLTQHENNAHLLQELSDAAYQVTTTLNQLLNRLTSASRAVGESLSNLVDVCTSPVSKEKRFNTEKTFHVQEYSKSFNDTGFVDQTNSTRNLNSLDENIIDISTLTKRYDYNHDTHINNENYGYHKSTHDYQLQSTTNEIEKQQILQKLSSGGTRGNQACINAASTVSGIIGDLDTTILFATAGTLHAENENETFSDHRENILKTAKALVEDTKTLVTGAASSQEQLAVAAQNAVSTIIQLADVVKFGAASLGANNPEAQVMLINAIKDVATALGDLIQATKAASGKNINDPSMNKLKESAKVMVTNVTSLLKTVKAVEDEHTRGTRALESTIEVIGQEIRALNSTETFKSTATVEELIRCTKPITMATAKAVSAGNSGKQEDVIVAANIGRKAISDLLTVCRGCSNTIENPELKTRTLQAGHDIAQEYRKLLQTVFLVISKPNSSSDSKHMLQTIPRLIAQYVTELISVTEIIKGNDWVSPEDPTIIAENELLGAAESIDAAAKKLAGLRPRRSVVEEDAHASWNFDEVILEAAKSIAAATSALVKAASAAQRELIDSGKVSGRPLTNSDDGQWSEGLISASRLVAAATHSLVESANALIQGISSEEKLISAAKQVASSTAQLLVSCKVKADPDSASTKILSAAGNAVKRATDNLVKGAQQAIQNDEERSLVLSKRMVGGIAQEINARSEVLRIERELEEARQRLVVIRQAKYKAKEDGTSPTELLDNDSSFEHQFISSRRAADHYNNSSSSLDVNGDNIQTNAYSVYKLLNNSNDQTSLNSFNETFHSGTNKLYSYNNTTGSMGSNHRNVYSKNSMPTINNTVKYNCSSTISSNGTTTTKSYTVNE